MKTEYLALYICFGIIFLMGCFFAIQDIIYSNPDTNDLNLNYTFFLDGENVDSIMVCEDEWHYDLIDGFIPCVVNKTIGGIGGETIDWSLSPQENCQRVGGEFTGLNLYNKTRAKELYDALLPKCFELKEGEISNIWLNVSNCFCLDEDKYLNSSFVSNCDEYNCGGGLFVNRR